MDFELIRSNRRTIAAEIKGTKLIIRAPFRASNEDINRFMLQHRKWIETHLAQAQQQAQEQARAVAQGDESRCTFTAEEIRQLADKARQIIPERVAYYAPRVGVSYGRITIRSQRTRWGSCSRKGNLNFNCLLMLTPPEVLDSVVVHELCHRREMNHSERFYAQVLRVFPEYWKWHKWLKENGPALMARLG